jgi:uroporphyrinogen decarboxylase
MDALKQDFIDVMEYGHPRKVPNWEAGVWGQTKDRWYSEGLDPATASWEFWEGETSFGCDRRTFIPLETGYRPQFEQVLLEEDQRYEIYRDTNGITRKALKEGATSETRASMDEYIDFPVKVPADFADIRKRLQLDLEERYPRNWRSDLLNGWRTSDVPVILGRNCDTWGFYWKARELMGTENLCYGWYDYPALMHEMMEFIADFLIGICGPLLAEMDVDYVMISEDMAMKSGPLLSPATYREFIFPHMRRLVDFLKSNGVAYVMVDTDGNPEPLIPLLMDAGVDALWPIERASENMDPVALRKKYGKDLRLFGAVDKRELAKDRRAIDEHLRSLAPLVEQGGFIPTVDHTVPPDVSLDNFLYYMEKKDRLLSGM